MRMTLTSSPGYLYDEHDAYESFSLRHFAHRPEIIRSRRCQRVIEHGVDHSANRARSRVLVTLLLDIDAEDWTLKRLRPFLRCFALKEGA